MALSFLLDEQMWPEVAVQIQARRPEITISSVQTWRNGALRGQPDDRVLRAAREADLTLVTYDIRTIPPLLVEWANAGVIFIDNRTLLHRDIGGQVEALIQQWEQTQEWEGTDLVLFLRPAQN